MTITSGLGQAFYLGGYDLSGDTGSADNISSPLNTQDITAISGRAVRRLGLLRDGAISWMSYFNPALAAAHSVLSTLPTTDRHLMWATGSTLGNPAACMVGKQIGYDGTRAQDGSFTLKVDAQANAYGLEWCQLLTAGQRTDTTATNGTSLDLGAGSTTFGLQAYLQVLSFTGTSCTIALQESSDNGAGDAFAAVTGGAFTAVTAAPQAQRIQTARTQTVERYLRVATTGTFSNIVFLVAVNRNPVAVNF
ncbi:hypothetical protein [Streptomyces sp. NPDC057257]|uniref:hypothetical protein n=1 Tax=Streptomyces sp. NPDC057257 TaxID=3346071 RepID=UPI00363A9C2D